MRLDKYLKVSRLIKRRNDFGAGGVAVASGERADGRDRTAHLERGGKNQGEHCNGREMSHEGGGC